MYYVRIEKEGKVWILLKLGAADLATESFVYGASTHRPFRFKQNNQPKEEEEEEEEEEAAYRGEVFVCGLKFSSFVGHRLARQGPEFP